MMRRVAMGVSGMRAGLTILGIVVMVGVARGDLIELNDGRTISGEMRREGDVRVITSSEGVETRVSAGDVKKVTLGGGASTQESGKMQWARIKVGIGKAERLADVIAGIERFLKEHPEGEPAAEARKMLEEYRKLSLQGPVKLRGKWLSFDEAEGIKKAWLADAKAAEELLTKEDFPGAVRSAAVALKKDDGNPRALMVTGLGAYAMKDLGKARWAFAKLAELEPENVAALNNLGVIAYDQKKEGEGCAYLAKAVALRPVNAVVLDNAVLAWQRFSGDRKKATSLHELERNAKGPEGEREKEMAAKGLQRWGVTWLTDKEWAEANAKMDGLKKKLGELDAEYKNANTELSLAESALNNAQRGGNALEDDVAGPNMAVWLAQGAIDGIKTQVEGIRKNATAVRDEIGEIDKKRFGGPMKMLGLETLE
jgi:Tfp pilus assembly protein PilF